MLLSERGLRNKRWKIFTFNKDHTQKELAVVRKVPRKWLKELDPYCPVTRGERRRLFRLKNEN
jgi:UDP-galactopyranose mutase